MKANSKSKVSKINNEINKLGSNLVVVIVFVVDVFFLKVKNEIN